MIHGLPEKVIIDGVDYNLIHLLPFVHRIPGQGPEKGELAVRVTFHSHVFSRQPKPEDVGHHFDDEGGRQRIFCPDRFAFSYTLPDLCRRMLDQNFLTWQEKDKNSVSNLAVIDGPLRNGEHRLVVYYLIPSKVTGIHVELVVKSCYPKELNFTHRQKRDRVVYLVKKCLYDKKKIPR